MAKIIGPGSLIVDITGFAPHLPVHGETTMGSAIRTGPGGKGSNQMTAAHRAGSEVYIIGKRGDDALGNILRDHYKKENMSEKYVEVIPGASTAGAFIEVDERDAQNRIIVVLSVNAEVTAANVTVAEEDFATADAVLTQFETTMDAVLKTKELAQKYNKPFILNPAPFVETPDGLFDGIDYITPNETEAEQLTGIPVVTDDDCRAAAKKLLSMGVKNVVITLGVRGSYFTDGAREIFTSPIKVEAKETTGAGDAFNGGFATAVAEGLPIDVALKFATATAAISVTRFGSSPSMPYRREILDLMEKEYGIKL